MKHERMHARRRDGRPGLGELERLVLSEIDSLASTTRVNQATRRPSHVEPSVADLTGFLPTTAATEDAIAFIDRVLAWVQKRPDRNVIVTELWSRLLVGSRIPARGEPSSTIETGD